MIKLRRRGDEGGALLRGFTTTPEGKLGQRPSFLSRCGFALLQWWCTQSLSVHSEISAQPCSPLHGRVIRGSVEAYNVGRVTSHNIGRTTFRMVISGPNRLPPGMERMKRRTACADCFSCVGCKPRLVSLEPDSIGSSAQTGSSSTQKGQHLERIEEPQQAAASRVVTTLRGPRGSFRYRPV